MALQILVLNGPNLNLLGTREPEIYGTDTLDDILTDLRTMAEQRGVELRDTQSNSEGSLIDSLHHARGWADGVIFNPGAFTHYSIALRDAVVASELPVVETHLSNVHAREEFRHHSYVSGVAAGVICGLGAQGYEMAIDALATRLNSL